MKSPLTKSLRKQILIRKKGDPSVSELAKHTIPDYRQTGVTA